MTFCIMNENLRKQHCLKQLIKTVVNRFLFMLFYKMTSLYRSKSVRRIVFDKPGSFSLCLIVNLFVYVFTQGKPRNLFYLHVPWCEQAAGYDPFSPEGHPHLFYLLTYPRHMPRVFSAPLILPSVLSVDISSTYA